MLFTSTTLPVSNGGLPWGTIILAAVIIGGVGYVTYQVMNDSVTISNPKTDENERG